MSRKLLRLFARWIVGVLLTGQLAVAAYACPTLLDQAGVPEQHSLADSQARGESVSMPGCDGAPGASDPTLPNLCAEHCKTGQQSDHSSSIVVPLAWPVVLYDIRPPAIAEPRRRPTAASLSDLVAATPSHAILHCVRRT